MIRPFLRETGDLADFTAGSVRALPGVPRFFSEALCQAAVLVRGSTLFIFVMSVIQWRLEKRKACAPAWFAWCLPVAPVLLSIIVLGVTYL